MGNVVAPPALEEELKALSAYLTDDRMLVYVVDAAKDHILLENCLTFEQEWVPVQEILGAFRVVRR